jgi:GntR family transcriptional regulator/MocR family aminotransferase
MDVHIQLSGRGDLSTRIYRQLLDAVLDGRLRAGERLPPTRVLARRLSVSRNTVAVAYERLAAEGVLVGRVGAGSFITTESIRQVRARRAPAGSLQARPQWRSLKVPASSAAADVQYDFSVGVPDPGLFPFEHWRRAVGAELGSSRSALAGYGDPAGLDRLREAIARHIGLSRAVRANAADVIVTNGAQQAIDLVAKVLVPPGTCVAVEDPGYLYARLAFRSLGARVVGVPVDAEGIDVARIPAAAVWSTSPPRTSFLSARPCHSSGG